MPRNAKINVAGMATADTNPTAPAYRSSRLSSARRSMLSIAVSSALIAEPRRRSQQAHIGGGLHAVGQFGLPCHRGQFPTAVSAR